MKSILVGFALLFSVTAFAADPKTEIEALLSYVGALEGATFIRNGTSYPTAQAVAHLRLKWQNAGKQVKTAEQFITLCAAKSSTTGERYRVRLAAGKERWCDELLSDELLRLRQGAKSK